MYNTLGANGENWNAYGQYIFNGGLNLASSALTSWITAKYGSQTLQQVQQNPNSDSSQQILQQFLMWQMSQNQNQNLTQEKEKDNTMLYVLIGFGALALIMMNNNSGSRR